MRREPASDIVANSHELMNRTVVETAALLSDAYFVYKIDDLLNERGITQKDLAKMTGMRVGTISQLVNGKTGVSLNKTQLLALVVALRVTNLSDILEIRIPQETLLKYQLQRAEWIIDKKMPMELKELYRANVLKSANLD